MSYTYDYPMPSITADIVLFSPDKSHILCVTRKNEPFKGYLCLPGGYISLKETLKESALRELREETSIEFENKDLIFVNIFDQVDRDTRGRVISACFTGVMKEYKMPTAGDDAAKADWTLVGRFLNHELTLGFDHHVMLMQAMEKIK